jgi:hypothetical protein
MEYYKTEKCICIYTIEMLVCVVSHMMYARPSIELLVILNIIN